MKNLIVPHGSDTLKPLFVGDSSERNSLTEASKDMPKLLLNSAAAANAVMLGAGYFTPLNGFMCIKEIESVLSNNKLLTGENWTLPIILQVTQKEIETLPSKGQIILIDDKNQYPVGILEIQSIEKFTPENFIKKWFGTDNKNHPGIKEVIIPKENKKDLVDMPKKIIDDIKITPVEFADQVLKIALTKELKEQNG